MSRPHNPLSGPVILSVRPENVSFAGAGLAAPSAEATKGILEGKIASMFYLVYPDDGYDTTKIIT